MADTDPAQLTTLTAEIVAAYVSHNSLVPGELAGLIGEVHKAMSGAGQPAEPAEPETPKPDKAAIRKSIASETLTSFVDGRKYKSLKRHLSTNGLTPAQYRERYGLADDYPMVASGYSARRSELARSIGLGRKRATPPEPAPKRGRRKQAEQTQQAQSEQAPEPVQSEEMTLD